MFAQFFHLAYRIIIDDPPNERKIFLTATFRCDCSGLLFSGGGQENHSRLLKSTHHVGADIIRMVFASPAGG